MKKKKKNQPKACINCEHCIYLGEGGHVCDITYDTVLEDWIPTEYYMECGGRQYEKSTDD